MIGRKVTTLLAAACLSVAVLGCQHGGSHAHIANSEAPPAVVDGFHREFPGLTIAHVDRITAVDGSTLYELKFRDAQNHYHRKLFTADGKLNDTKDNVESNESKNDVELH